MCGDVEAVASVVRGFFFQAEDGIRDLVRSRGLGDVYKRQVRHLPALAREVVAEPLPVLAAVAGAPQVLVGEEPVSYTHLTLPTSDLV